MINPFLKFKIAEKEGNLISKLASATGRDIWNDIFRPIMMNGRIVDHNSIVNNIKDIIR